MAVTSVMQGIKGGISGIGKGAFADKFFTVAGNTGALVTIVIFFMLALAVVILLMRQMMMYNVDVYVFRRYSSGLRLLKLKGRRYKDKEGKYRFAAVRGLFQLKPYYLNLVDLENFMPNFGKGESLFLVQVGPDDYKPIRFMDIVKEKCDALDFTILDVNAANHTLAIHREIVQRHQNKNKLLLYLPTIMMVGGMIFVVVLLWMTLGRIETMNHAMTEGYKLMAEAIKDFGKQIIT